MSLKLIYLDQCAACELALRLSPWDRIRNLIESKVAEERILCPLPYETVLESTACDKPTRIALTDLVDKISGGWKIKCFDELIGEETIHLVRTQPIRLLDRYANLIPVDDDHNKRMARAFEDAKSDMEARAQAFQYEAEQLGRPVAEVKKSVDLGRAGQLYRDIKRLLAGQTAGMECPAFAQDLIRAKFTKEELEELIEHIIHHRFDAIPVNFIEARMGAQWEYEMTRLRLNPRKYKFNDEIDRWRAAVALAYCDMLITDSGAAAIARAAVRGFENAFTCQIFSVRETDAIEQAITSI